MFLFRLSGVGQIRRAKSPRPSRRSISCPPFVTLNSQPSSTWALEWTAERRGRGGELAAPNPTVAGEPAKGMLIFSRQNPETDASRTTAGNMRSRAQWNRDEVPHGAAGELGENQESGLFVTYRQARAIPAPKAFEALSHLPTG